MEGPTPVSALIHAATMVAAGVFLVARVYPLFSLGAIDGVTPSLTVVVWIGVITALMAALIAVAQVRYQTHPRLLNRLATGLDDGVA